MKKMTEFPFRELLRQKNGKNACYGAHMLDPGSLLPMIRSEIAIFDLTYRFYGMKNFIYVSWNRL